MLGPQALAFATAANQFNLTQCPAWYELQSAKVKANFDHTKMLGTYYELALHDFTQYPACPKSEGGPQCVQSIKTFDPKSGQYGTIDDHWTLQCAGVPIPQRLAFDLTDHPGYFMGLAKKKFGADYTWPDTVVDYKLTADGSAYEWIIEFQCNMEADQSQIAFVGINFYARHYNVTNMYYDEFIERGYKAGLGVYMDYDYGLYKVPMNDCKWFTDEQPLFHWYPEPVCSEKTAI